MNAGSEGEGGGQILRNGMALAALTGSTHFSQSQLHRLPSDAHRPTLLQSPVSFTDVRLRDASTISAFLACSSVGLATDVQVSCGDSQCARRPDLFGFAFERLARWLMVDTTPSPTAPQQARDSRRAPCIRSRPDFFATVVH